MVGLQNSFLGAWVTYYAGISPLAFLPLGGVSCCVSSGVGDSIDALLLGSG